MFTVKKKKKNSTFYSILSLHILNKNVYYVLLWDRQSKQINWKTFAYANENLNILIYNLICMYFLYHFSIKYHVEFFLKVALPNFNAFLSSDRASTVKANWILYRIMTYNKTARGKSKQKRTQPQIREYIYREFCSLVTAL